MTRNEFLNHLSDSDTIPDDEEYRMIDFVYTWHPSISGSGHEGQKQIAYLYSEFGMRIIADMFPTARKAEAIRNKISKAKAQIADYEREFEELSLGPYDSGV